MVREGNTEKAVGASTAAKKKMEPIHNVSDSNRTKRKKVKMKPPEIMKKLNGYGHAVYHFAQNLFGLFGALEG